MGWMVQGSYSGGSKIFPTCPDWPWDPPSLPYNGYWVSFIPGVKKLRHGVDLSPRSGAEVKERVELYFYSPCGPSWPIVG